MKPFLPLLIVLAASACAGPPAEAPPRTVQPGAPGEDSRVVSAPRVEAAGHTRADVAFMQAMIPHHAQALVMTELVPERTERREIRLLAERIEASQDAEIAQMRGWLRRRGETAPAEGAGGHGGHAGHGDTAGMHGMATPAQLERLAASRGPAFDRLFLELMIRHHEGALAMTRDLLAVEGAGREPELFQLISHIDADQRAEIARMRRLLETL